MSNNPDLLVGLTDLVLSLEALVLCFLYRTAVSKMRNLVMILFFLLGIASFAGGLFHILFPLKVETASGSMMWLCVTATMGLTALSLWSLTLYSVFKKRYEYLFFTLGLIAFAGYMYVIAAINYHYIIVIAFYTPALLAFSLLAISNFLKKKNGWGMVTLGVALTIVAALVQVSSIAVSVLDHNALYHILQAVALIVLYAGFTRLKE